jgi:SAM-dependent methyltransferase
MSMEMDVKLQTRDRVAEPMDYRYEAPSKKIEIDSDDDLDDIDTSLKLLSDAYTKLQSGYDISRQEVARAKKEGRYEEVAGLGYGEVDVEAFGNFVKALPSTHANGVFLDLGSGSGKAVLAAAFDGTFSSCIGVEIVAPLHSLATQALERAREIDAKKASKVSFVQGDMFAKEELCRLADVVLVTCTLFTDEMMVHLDEAVDELIRPGTIVITTTRRLRSIRARQVSEGRVKYAKGSLLFIVYVVM